MADISETVIIFILFLHSATSQTSEVARIDALMTTDRQKCIDAEVNLATVLANLSTTVEDLASTLKSNFLSRELVTSLENLDSLMKMQMTVNNFEPYVNISTCGDINYKITMIEFDQQKILRCIIQGRTNATDLYVRYAQVAAFSGRVVTTQYYSSVLSIMRRTVNILTEYNRLLGVYSQSYSNLAISSALLNAFKRNYCSCLKTAAITGYNSTLETNVNFIENRLITLQNMVKNQINISLNNVKAAYSSVISKKLIYLLFKKLL